MRELLGFDQPLPEHTRRGSASALGLLLLAALSSSPLSSVQAGTCASSVSVINVAPAAPSVGESTQITVRVMDTGPGMNTPGGRVRVSLAADERCLLALNPTVPATAEGTCKIRPLLSGGTRMLTADYLGDGNCLPTSVNQGLTVNQAAANLQIVLDQPDPSQISSGFTVTARLQPAFAAPSGSIVFDHSGEMCTAVLPEQSCIFTSTISGLINITASYAGDANFSGAASPSVPHDVLIDPSFEILSGGAAGVSSGFGSFNDLLGTEYRISDDGRFLIFESLATNLAPDDSNDFLDVYLLELRSGLFERVSLADDESEGDGDSYVGDISADGRFVLFASDATNLIGAGNDTNGQPDAFVRDRVAGTTVRVSLADGMVELPTGVVVFNRRTLSISGDGSQATFATLDPASASDSNGVVDCYMRSTTGGGSVFPVSTSSAGSYGDNTCDEAVLNFDGTRVAFVSTASNLGQTTDVNGLFGEDVFLKATDGGQPGLTTFISESVATPGNTGNFASSEVDIDASGQLIVFSTQATDLFTPDGNARADVVLYDTTTGTLVPLSIFAGSTLGDGDSGSPKIASHGLFVAFESEATNLVTPDTNGSKDVLVVDLDTGTLRRDSVNSGGTEGSQDSYSPVISEDGRVVVFQSDSGNLDPTAATPFSANLFARLSVLGQTRWISRTPSGDLGNGNSIGVDVSGDGGTVVFDSLANNLVPGDGNGSADIFRVNRPAPPSRISLTTAGAESNGDSFDPSISNDGAFTVFASVATNLVVGADSNGASDIFLLPTAGAPASLIRISNAFGAANASDGESNEAVISGNGNFVAFTSSATDLVSPSFGVSMPRVYVYDRIGDSIEHVSVNTAGIAADSFASDPSISDDGCKVSFESDASNLDPIAPGGFSYVFVRDRCLMTTEVVSVDNTMPTPLISNGNSFGGRIAGDGNSIVFLSDGDNLDPSDLNSAADAFVRTLGASPTTFRVSLDGSNAEIPDVTERVDISTDGNRILFVNRDSGIVVIRGSKAIRGVPSPTTPNNVYLRELSPPSTTQVSRNMGGFASDGYQPDVAISGDGGTAVFSSSASNLSPGDGNGLLDIYLSALVPAGPAICTWNGGSSTWDDPAAWSNCGTGSGTVAGTPGPTDTAIINAGTVDLSGDETVDVLQMTGGTLVGDANLIVSSAFDWSGGTLAATAASPSITLSSVAISNWTGGDKFLTDRQLINDGMINWSSGLIHLQDTLINNSSSGVWNWQFNGPVEYIDRTGGASAVVQNDGLIQKSGTSDGELRNGVDFVGMGNFQVASATLLLGGNGGFSGNLDVSAGATLILAEGVQGFDGASSFSGSGDLQFGTPSPAVPGLHNIDGAFTLTGTVRVESAQVLFNLGTPSITTLQLLDPASAFGGMATPTIVGALNWNAGVIFGGPGEQLVLDMGATSVIAGTPGDLFARLLDGRQIINDGLLQQVQGNGTRVINGGQIVNSTSGVFDFPMPGGAIAAIVADDADPGNLLDNQGTLSMNGGQQMTVDLPFDNSGAVDINAGALIIQRSGLETGDYMVDNPGSLLLLGHSRTFPAGSDLTGSSSLYIDSAAVIDLQGIFGLTRIDLLGGSTLSWSQAGPLNMNTLVVDGGSTLNTQGPINVAGGLFARNASINGATGVQTLTSVMGGSAFLPNAGSDVLTLTDIDFHIDGSAQLQAGTINLDGGSLLTIGATGQLDLAANTGIPVNLGCGSCGTAMVTNLGTLRQVGVGLGNDAFISSPVALSNQGTVDIQSQVLSIDTYAQTGPGAMTQVAAGATLQSGTTIQLNGGFLSGGG
ncbi:MAG: hypothetical protein KDI71_04380, partial [Xanthomonadales bacterium]|nr:hypothetical protein [Xanthomonadales bacterium]